MSQQVFDLNFDARVARPTYINEHPKVLFDEAHLNFHTTVGGYKPFVELITHDGYQVTPQKDKFQTKILANYDILVIANALSTKEGLTAFTNEECDVVRNWVRNGGSLLLIADHAPFGAAAENLSMRFGVQMSKGFTIDMSHYDTESGNPGWLFFTRDHKLLATHPITQGRNVTEWINRVLTFTGQSLKGPDGSIAFLRLADTAVDLKQRISKAQALPPNAGVSAAGKAQGIALQYGKGRVVVLGEAAMLSAQLITGPVAQQLMGKDVIQMGMNHAGLDNRQLALNIMHWLSKLLN
ncbi:hypothetical protein SD80_008210 [Scytonema tolypothrichoides VB-61278]|nr:hypothetical protein SD80_008210 [Scytonema tolypothrichoides VB-61278]